MEVLIAKFQRQSIINQSAVKEAPKTIPHAPQEYHKCVLCSAQFSSSERLVNHTQIATCGKAFPRGLPTTLSRPFRPMYKYKAYGTRMRYSRNSTPSTVSRAASKERSLQLGGHTLPTRKIQTLILQRLSRTRFDVYALYCVRQM